jgi:hypothetical protein
MQSNPTSVHDRLTESLRDAHAEELRKAIDRIRNLEALHAAEKKLLAERLSAALEKVEWLRKLAGDAIADRKSLVATVESQQKALSAAMADLVILKGGRGRPAIVQEEHSAVRLQPDVEAVDEAPAAEIVKSRQQLLRDAEDEYQRVIQGLDAAKATPEARAAAMPATVEEWNEEHAQPADEPLSAVPAELR